MSFRTIRGADGFEFIHDNEMEQVGYPILRDLPAVQKAAKILARHISTIRHTNGFHAINLCVMGCSGATLGAFVGVELTALGEDKVGFYHVKKPNETHHRCEVADTAGTRHPRSSQRVRGRLRFYGSHVGSNGASTGRSGCDPSRDCRHRFPPCSTLDRLEVCAVGHRWALTEPSLDTAP